MEKASRRPMRALTVVMPTVWAGQMISSIGMCVVFVLLDAKALLLGIWGSFPLRVGGGKLDVALGWDSTLCTVSSTAYCWLIYIDFSCIQWELLSGFEK